MDSWYVRIWDKKRFCVYKIDSVSMDPLTSMRTQNSKLCMAQDNLSQLCQNKYFDSAQRI